MNSTEKENQQGKRNKNETETLVTLRGSVRITVRRKEDGTATATVEGAGTETAMEADSCGEAREIGLEEADRILRAEGWKRVWKRRKGYGI